MVRHARPAPPSLLLAALVPAVIALTGCGGPSDAPSTPAAGSPSVITQPLPTRPVDVTVLGSTGDALWVRFTATSDTSPLSGHQVSLDGGRTWSDGPHHEDGYRSAAGAGRFGLYGGDDGENWPMTIDPATPAVPRNFVWNEEWSLAAIGPTRALATNGRLVGVGSQLKVRFPKLPPGVGTVKHSLQFSADSAFLVRASHPARGRVDYLSVVTTATGHAARLARLPRSRYHVVGGTSLFSLVGDAAGLKVCRVALASGEQRCDDVATGDHRASKAVLYQAGEISLVKDGAAALMLEGGAVVPLTLPPGTASWALDGPGDPSRPLIRTVDRAGEPHHLRVGADGTTTEWLTLARVPVQPFGLALTPTTLLGSDLLPATGVWARDVSAGTLGGRTGVPGASVATASGSRWLIHREGFKAVQVYDEGTPDGAIRHLSPRLQSGPYLIGTPPKGREKVAVVGGKTLKARRPMALFGSLVVEDVSTSHTHGYTVRVRDLAGGFTSKPFALTDHPDLYSWVWIWGEWVGTSVFSDAEDHDFDIVLHNYLTGATRTHPGELAYLGDGFAVVRTPDSELGYPLKVWDLGTGTETPLRNGSGYGSFAVDGDRIAYTTDTDLVLRTLEGVATSPPRLLGAMTRGRASVASPWRLEADLTKAVDAGRILIRDKDGLVVRTLATATSATGSLRGISWDGRDAAGIKVAKGTFRWELVVHATDGSGAATSVTGTAPPGGRIRVG